MVRVLILCILFLPAFTTHAELPNQIVQITGDVEEMRLHVRSTLPEYKVTFEADSITNLSFRVKNKQKGDGTYQWQTAVYKSKEYKTDYDALVTTLLKADVDHETSAFSLCITADADGVHIDAGDGTRIFDGQISLNDINGTTIKMYPAPKETDIVDFDVRYKPERKMCRFADLEQLNSYLAASSDSIESIWRWVDCQTDAPAVKAGGRYMLATVANDNDGYDIVYIDGANIGEWQPLEIKGSMKPTDFISHYDATWLDSEGHDAGEGVYIDIDDGGIMTVRFAPLKSELRFIRVRKQ